VAPLIARSKGKSNASSKFNNLILAENLELTPPAFHPY